MNNLDWDYDGKDNLIGYLSMYSTSYDSPDDIREQSITFSLIQLEPLLVQLKELIRDHLGDSEKELIGINSNSFIKRPGFNHIFLEWDAEHGIPSWFTLNEFGGIITQTAKGFHLIKEAEISADELYELQTKMGCCRNFTKYTLEKGYSTLRITPKENNILSIIKYEDGLLYNVYRELIVNLGGVYAVGKEGH